MQYMGGKSRIARYIAEIINNTLNGGGAFNEIPRRQEPYSNTFGADPQRYGGACFVSLFWVAAPLKAKLPAMTALY